MNGFNHSENRRGQYYWHNWNGQNYCHYYDGCYNWYGWYGDGNCFWSCYYGNDWWWYDSGFARWDYWNDGNWWWQNPYNVNVTYLYNNGDYVPANQSNNDGSNGGYAQNGDNGNYQQSPGNDGQSGDDYSNEATGGELPNQANESSDRQSSLQGEIVFQSETSSRCVKIMGESGDAFLFDNVSKSFKPVYLGSGIKGVRFTGSGKGLKVLLTLQDGSVETFKADGKPEKSATAA